MKINGVSLIPAASPTPVPLPLMRSGSARSPTTRASSTRLICPKNSVIATGSSQRPTAAIANAAAALGQSGGPPGEPQGKVRHHRQQPDREHRQPDLPGRKRHTAPRGEQERGERRVGERQLLRPELQRVERRRLV